MNNQNTRTTTNNNKKTGCKVATKIMIPISSRARRTTTTPPATPTKASLLAPSSPSRHGTSNGNSNSGGGGGSGPNNEGSAVPTSTSSSSSTTYDVDNGDNTNTNTNTNTTGLYPAVTISSAIEPYDNYTDYSCSTSIERLARDIETILHKWHVNKGSDRHVSTKNTLLLVPSRKSSSSSFSQQQQQQQQSTSTTTSKNTFIESRTNHKYNSDNATVLTQQSSSSSVVAATAASISSSPSSSQSSSTILRREIIHWNISFTTASTATATATATAMKRIVANNIALELILWDSPSTPQQYNQRQCPQQNQSQSQSQNQKHQQQQQTKNNEPTQSSSSSSSSSSSKITTQAPQTATTNCTTDVSTIRGNKRCRDSPTSIPKFTTATTASTTTTTTTIANSNTTSTGAHKQNLQDQNQNHHFLSDGNESTDDSLDDGISNINTNNNTSNDTDTITLPYSVRRRRRRRQNQKKEKEKNRRYRQNQHQQQLHSDETEDCKNNDDMDIDDMDGMDGMDGMDRNGDGDVDVDVDDEYDIDDECDIDDDDVLLHPPPGSLFADFSFTYGIGQYITLSPIDPEKPLLEIDNDNEDADADEGYRHDNNRRGLGGNTTRSNINSIGTKTPSMLLEYLSNSLIYRHNYYNTQNQLQQHQTRHNIRRMGSISSTATTSSTSTVNSSNSMSLKGTTGLLEQAYYRSYLIPILSNWLQTSLNLASSSCNCRFPIFGIWCKYNNNTNTKTSTSTSANASSSTNMNTSTSNTIVSTNTNTNINTNTIDTIKNNTNNKSSSSVARSGLSPVSIFPEWIDDLLVVVSNKSNSSSTNTTFRKLSSVLQLTESARHSAAATATTAAAVIRHEEEFVVREQRQQRKILPRFSTRDRISSSSSSRSDRVPSTTGGDMYMNKNSNTIQTKKPRSYTASNSLQHQQDYYVNNFYECDLLDTIQPISCGKLLSDDSDSTFRLYALTPDHLSTILLRMTLGHGQHQYQQHKSSINNSNLYDIGYFPLTSTTDGSSTSSSNYAGLHNVLPPPRWTYWGSLLQQHCRQQLQKKTNKMIKNHRWFLQSANDYSAGDKNISHKNTSSSFVNLWHARHTYSWCKAIPPKSGIQRLLWLGTNNSDTEWRPGILQQALFENGRNATSIGSSSSTNKTSRQFRRFILYRNQCRSIALQRIEHAAGSTRSEPLWGPPDDPILSVHVILTWNGSRSHRTNDFFSSSNNSNGINSVPSAAKKENEKTGTQPLLALPLKSRHALSDSDWIEMEDATESAILDIHQPTVCEVSVQYDHNTAPASLAATQRCVLAALIRTSTLPKETLLSHTVDEGLMDQWDREAGNKIAGILARKAGVDSTTAALVAAMDWTTASYDMMERYQADDIIKKVFLYGDDGSTSTSLIGTVDYFGGFPSPPEGFAGNLIAMMPNNEAISLNKTNAETESLISLLFKPIKKGAPPGRLLSLLCIHMARVRTPCSMALIWMSFCQTLRQRWDARESLPNMRYVPGLDPINPNSAVVTDESGMDGNRNARSSSNNNIQGDRYPVDFIYGSNSLVGNANLAALVNSTEPDLDTNTCLIGQKLQVFNIGLDASTAIEFYDEKEFTKTDYKSNGVDPRTRSTASSNNTSFSSDTDEFYDASDSEFPMTISTLRLSQLYQQRRGARCPVQGASLLETGEQLYAPYLQRTSPLTDDAIAEQRLMLLRGVGEDDIFQIHQRHEVAQRILRPKLFSDMQSFKAANPGSVFHDFVSWYGYRKFPIDGSVKNDIFSSSTKQKSAELMLVADQTRDFWMRTWEEADAIPAIEQGALFDPETTVEMAIDYLENIHPASLLCQVSAINLSSAYFALVVSAGDTVRVGMVGSVLLHLREKIESALHLLSIDAVRATGSLHVNNARNYYAVDGTDVSTASKERTNANANDKMMMASIEALTACSKACEALGQTEVFVARAASLLHKSHQQYNLVDQILRTTEGTPIRISDYNAQQSLLNTIHKRQKQIPAMSSGDGNLKPAVREYMLRNMDDSEPCQLSVRYSDEGMQVFSTSTAEEQASGGILLALSMTSKE